MNGKPHFWMRYGYWHCRADGFTGAGYTQAEAFESLNKCRRFWLEFIGLSYDT